MTHNAFTRCSELGDVPTYDKVRRLLSEGSGVLLDGALGSELVRRGVRWRWHGLRTDAAEVQALHGEYIDAGAHVIRTNTFQLNRRIYLNVFRDADHMRHIGAPGLAERAEELMRQAVALARRAAEAAEREVAIAGVMSPLEHCFRPDLSPPEAAAAAEHGAIANLLAAEGVDLLLLESMNTTGEARAAAEAALATGLPVWVSFVIGPEGEILSGEALADGAKAMDALGVDAILVNCAPPDDLSRAIPKLRSATAGAVGAFAQVGAFNPPSWKFEFHPQFSGTEAWPPERYTEKPEGWPEAGASILGGCCGTTPAHIRALKAAL